MQQVEIRVSGQIDQQRSDWFDGLMIVSGESGTTILAGPITDQTAVYGLLAKLRDLGLALLSVQVREQSDGLDVPERDSATNSEESTYSSAHQER